MAHQCLLSIKSDIDKTMSDDDRMECCFSGMFGLVLKLMGTEPRSPCLQKLGLDCLYSLMGRDGVEDGLPLAPDELRAKPLSEPVRSTVVATLLSLMELSNGGCGLQVLIDCMKCIVEYFNTKMSSKERQ